MVNILISPTEGCGGFVVLLDVAHELPGQVGGGSENSPRDHIALNFGKPDFDLIEPARIGRGVMDPNGWLSLEELENIPGLNVRSNCRPRCEFLCPRVGWPRSCPESRQIQRWYVERWFYR